MRQAFTAIWVLSILAELVAIGRLLATGLWRRYLALALFLVVDAAANILVWLVGGDKSLHATAWRIAAPASWAAQALMVGVIWRGWCRRYTGIGQFAVLAAGIFTLVAIAASLSVAGYDYQRLAWAGDLRALYAVRRGLLSALAVFLLLVVAFVRHFPPDVSPNLQWHTRISALLCLAMAAQSFIFNTGGFSVKVAQFTLSLICLVAFAAWATMLSRAGEIVTETPKIDPDKLARFDEIERGYLKGLRSAVGGGSQERPQQ